MLDQPPQHVEGLELLCPVVRLQRFHHFTLGLLRRAQRLKVLLASVLSCLLVDVGALRSCRGPAARHVEARGVPVFGRDRLDSLSFERLREGLLYLLLRLLIGLLVVVFRLVLGYTRTADHGVRSLAGALVLCVYFE